MSVGGARGASGWRNIASALRHRDYALFSYGHMPGLVGLWAQRIAVGWLAWELTASPAWLGIVAMADLLPAVFLAPFSGAIADRVDLTRLMLVTQVIIVLQSAALWLFTAVGWMDIWLLFALSLSLGFNHPFSTAARHNMFPHLLPPQDLAAGIAFNSLCFNVGRFAGPALAGWLIAWSGVEIVFALEAIAEVVMLVAVLFFRVRPKPRQSGKGGLGALTRDVREGFGYIARHPGIGPILLLLAASAITSRPSLELLPGFADEIFDRGAEGLGWLGAAVGLGGVLGAFWLTRHATMTGMTAVIIGQTTLMTVSMIAFGLLDSFWLALGALFVLGFAIATSGVGTQTILQWSVDPAMRGRVMSIYTLIFRGLPALGALIIGVAAEIFGLQATVAGAAAFSLIACLWAWRRRGRMAAHLELAKPGQPSGGSH